MKSKISKLKYEIVCQYLSKLDNTIELVNSKEGITLRDIKNKMTFTLEFDDYCKIINKKSNHIFKKMFKGNKLNILDCTGGFGRDALLLASFGNYITLIEENPVIMSMLHDAADRIDNEIVNESYKRISPIFGNCIDFIRHNKNKYDYIYFDFMFNTNNSALPNKRDQFLRKLVKNDPIRNKNIVIETIQRVQSKIIIKEHISSNDFNDLNMTNCYKENTVKYNLINSE